MNEEEYEDEYGVGQGSSSYSSSSSLSNPPAHKRPIVLLRQFAPLISAGFHISVFDLSGFHCIIRKYRRRQSIARILDRFWQIFYDGNPVTE
jgi:hypothetical protein